MLTLSFYLYFGVQFGLMIYNVDSTYENQAQVLALLPKKKPSLKTLQVSSATYFVDIFKNL